MSKSDRIKIAIEAADSALLLNTPAEVSRAAKAWNRASVLGLDTEFVRERTFYANIGLVQISDGQTVWLVDPLVDGTSGPLRDLLENTSILKLIHSPSEDRSPDSSKPRAYLLWRRFRGFRDALPIIFSMLKDPGDIHVLLLFFVRDRHRPDRLYAR